MRKLQGLSVHALRASGAWLLLCLAACGGSGEDVATAAALRRAQEAAATPVTLQQLPDLHQCLAGLSHQLKKAAALDKLSLGCLTGTYKGQTPKGDDCALKVDAMERRFTFSYGTQQVAVDWAVVAVAIDGQPVHNLESSDLDGARPGVQLTRFTAVPESVTETLALRAGLARHGPQGLPQISYLKVHAGKTEDLRCRFAT